MQHLTIPSMLLQKFAILPTAILPHSVWGTACLQVHCEGCKKHMPQYCSTIISIDEVAGCTLVGTAHHDCSHLRMLYKHEYGCASALVYRCNMQCIGDICMHPLPLKEGPCWLLKASRQARHKDGMEQTLSGSARPPFG